MDTEYKICNVLVLLSLAAVSAFALGSSSTAGNVVTLPIKVYAPNGFDATNGSQPAPYGNETVTINVADAGAVDSVGFWMHQPYYHLGGGSTFDEQEGFDNEGAVAISVNGGPFVDITDANTQCAFPEGQMGPYDNNPGSDNQGRTADNCIGGPTPSPRFSVPKSFSGGLETGDNTITFRFNGSKGTRSGYRVLHIAALGGPTTIQNVDWMAGGLLSNGTTTFRWSDPTTWDAPEGGDASNGRKLFTSRNTLTDHVHQKNPSMPGEQIVAACSDCHAKDGSDLWYFNYSNEAIIMRSRFHGLTEQQGKDIAAYIRSIQLTDNEGRSYEPPGRPWNPPFQPGPTYGLDGTGVNAWDELTDDESHYWAAGAGLDDYLNDPLEEGKYLFPEGGDPGNGVPPTGMNTFRDATTGKMELPWRKFASGTHDDIDHKKYPLAIQFPDWNRWLPDISPVGGISGGDIRTYNNYYDKYEWLAGDGNSVSWAGGNAGSLDPNNPDDMFRVFKHFGGMYREMGNFRDVSGKGAESAIDAKEDLSILQYNMVRVWAIHQHYDLYDHADQSNSHPKVDRPVSDYNDWTLDIGIMGQGRHFFDAAPHILGDLRQDADHWHFGSFLGQKWATHVWYQLQVTLDPGALAPSVPVDWQYQSGHMGEFSEHTNIDASYRQFASQVRRFQQSYDSNIGVCPSCEGDSKLEHLALWSKQGQPLHALYTFAPDQSNKWNRTSVSISEESKRQLTGAWLRIWWDSYKRPPISDFQQRQCADDNEWCWEPASHVPEPDGWVGAENIKIDRFYNGLKYASEGGVASGVVDSIATMWASPMWPEGNESNYQSNDLPYSWEGIASTARSTSKHRISLDPGWNYISSYVAPSDPSLSRVFAGVESLNSVKDERGRAFIPDFGVNQIETWMSSEGYSVYVDDANKVVLTGARIPEDTPIELRKGWNLLPVPLSNPMDAAVALESIRNAIKIVRDETGNEYVPAEGTNQIGDLVPGSSYAVYVTRDTTFTYPTGTRQ